MSANIVMMTRHRKSNGNPNKENWKILLRTGMGPLDTRPRPLPTQRGGGNRHLLRPHHHHHHHHHRHLCDGIPHPPPHHLCNHIFTLPSS